GRRYVEHRYLPPGTPEHEEFWRQHPGGRSNVHWPHYSLQPSLLRTHAVRAVGRFSEAPGFEREFAHRYTRRGWRTAFFDTICSRHIGGREAGPNAYARNRTAQWKMADDASARAHRRAEQG